MGRWLLAGLGGGLHANGTLHGRWAHEKARRPGSPGLGWNGCRPWFVSTGLMSGLMSV